MNQITNKIPYGLLSEEEKAQFCGEAKRRGLYELYGASGFWVDSGNESTFCEYMAYRLIIKDDEWYIFIINGNPHGDYQDDNIYILQGKEIRQTDMGKYDAIRPATQAEIEAAKPKELTLEEKVKANYPDYDVVMLKRNDCLDLVVNSPGLPLHITAQSMKGFRGYVFIHSENDWLVSNKPTKYSRNKYIQPVAVLFEREK